MGLQNNSKTDIIREKVYQYQVNQQEYTCQYRTYVLFQLAKSEAIKLSTILLQILTKSEMNLKLQLQKRVRCFLCFFKL